jgi:hypothetical protein
MDHPVGEPFPGILQSLAVIAASFAALWIGISTVCFGHDDCVWVPLHRDSASNVAMNVAMNAALKGPFCLVCSLSTGSV